MALLLTVNDIKAIRPIAKAVDDIARIEPYIEEAQQVELKKLLGNDFFFAIVEDPANYTDILDGKSYENSRGNTVSFKGIKTVLAYFSYARFLMNDQMKHTASGFVVKQNQFSEPASLAERTSKHQDCRSLALSYWEDCALFLNQFKTDYPLWSVGCGQKSSGIASAAKISSVNNRERNYGI